MSYMKFIITADDFGVSPVIDDAITTAVLKGCVTSVASFANARDKNGNFTVEKLRRLKAQFPHISAGLHFTLTSGDAVNGPSWYTRRRNRKKFRGILHQDPVHIDKIELEDELRAQIDVFTRAGVEIEHFSDHHGFLTLSKKTAEVYARVVSSYMQSINKPVPVRNPVLLSFIVNNGGPLDKSHMFGKARLGKNVRNLFRCSALRKIQFNFNSVHSSLNAFQQLQIPCTDYFVEHFYGSPSRAVLASIFNDTPTAKYNRVLSRVSPDPRAEVVVHLATKPADADTNRNYQDHLQEIRKHKGISLGYIRGKRVTEYKVLTTELPGMLPSVQLAGFA